MPRSVARLTWTSVEGRCRAAVGKRPPWLVESVSFSCRPPAGLGARPETGPRDLGSRCPRSGGADEERSERPPGRERAPQEATPEMGCMGPKDPAWFSAALLVQNEVVLAQGGRRRWGGRPS